MPKESSSSSSSPPSCSLGISTKTWRTKMFRRRSLVVTLAKCCWKFTITKRNYDAINAESQSFEFIFAILTARFSVRYRSFCFNFRKLTLNRILFPYFLVPRIAHRRGKTSLAIFSFCLFVYVSCSHLPRSTSAPSLQTSPPDRILPEYETSEIFNYFFFFARIQLRVFFYLFSRRNSRQIREFCRGNDKKQDGRGVPNDEKAR